MAAPPPAKKRINRRWTPQDDLRLVRALAADRNLVQQLVYTHTLADYDPDDTAASASASADDPDPSAEAGDERDPDDGSGSGRASKRARHAARPQYANSNRAMYSVLGELASGTPVPFSASAVRSRITTLKKWYNLFSSVQNEPGKEDIAGLPSDKRPAVSPPTADIGGPGPMTQSPVSAPASASAPSPSAADSSNEPKRVPVWFDIWHQYVASGLQADSLEADPTLDSSAAAFHAGSGSGLALGSAMGQDIANGSNATPTLTLPPLPGLSSTPASALGPAMGHDVSGGSNATPTLTLPPLPGLSSTPASGLSSTPPSLGAAFLPPGADVGAPRAPHRERETHLSPQLPTAYDRRSQPAFSEYGTYDSPHAPQPPPPLLHQSSGEYDIKPAVPYQPTSPVGNGMLPPPPSYESAHLHHPHPQGPPAPSSYLHSHSHSHPHSHSNSHSHSHSHSRSHSSSLSSQALHAPGPSSPHSHHPAYRPSPGYPEPIARPGYTSAPRRGEGFSPPPPPPPRAPVANPDRVPPALATLPAPAAPLAAGGFSAHLVALEPEAYRAAIAHPFLTAAAARTLPSEQIEAWLAQDRLYAGVGYLRFAGLMLARLPTLADGEGSALACTYGARIRAVLSGAISNVVREVQFFEDTAAHWGLDLGGDSTSLMAPYAPVTQAYCLYMLEVGQTGSPEEQMTLLWAMEKLYLEAWTTAASGQQAAAVGPPRGGELGGAAHVLDLFVQNWTCGAFRAFVTELGSLLDAIVPLDTSPAHVKARCEAVWRRALWFERYFWDAGRTSASDER